MPRSTHWFTHGTTGSADRSIAVGYALPRPDGPVEWVGMRRPEVLDIDPRGLHLRPSQAGGADPYKLQTQIARFGASSAGMPPPWVYRGSDGGLFIFNGVTRATRIARLAPGTMIRVEVVGEIRRPVGAYPKLGDTLP